MKAWLRELWHAFTVSGPYSPEYQTGYRAGYRKGYLDAENGVKTLMPNARKEQTDGS